MNKLIHNNLRSVLALSLVLFLSVNIKITAQTKNTIEYKTSIIDQNQRPMLDGTYNFRFAIYNVANGGSALWSEDRFGVQVRKAAISVDLGSINPFPQNLFKNTSLYLQVCMDANLAGGDGSGECVGSFEENFKPRKILTGVPWAFNASSLGPVNVSADQTAYNFETFGSDSTLLNLSFNDESKFAVDSTGTIKLTADSDIFFGDTISLKNFDSAETAGANLIGVSTAGMQNLIGDNLQTVLTNLDPLLRWKANGSSVYYNGGNIGIGTNSPAYALDVIGTGDFTNGIVIGNNTNNIAGAIRWTGAAFEGYNGIAWSPLGGGAGATTDNLAGVTYVTNLTNAFAVGGNTTATSPFVLDPSSGALLRRNTTIRNDPAAPSISLLSLDSSGANAQIGGSKNGIAGSFAYTPSSGTSTEIFNTSETNLIVNSGDGTDISRVRGYRTTIVNNSSGVVDGAFNLSAINTNNGTEQFQTGLNATLQNNANITGQMNAVSANVNNSGDAGLFMIGTASTATNNVGGITDQITASYNQTTNNGTTDYQYGTRNVVNNNGTVNLSVQGILNGIENDGTAPVAYGIQTNILNHPLGVITSDSFGIHNDNTNQGTIVGSLYGIYNNVSNSGIVSGNTIGLRSIGGGTIVDLNSNGTYAINTTGSVKSSNQIIVGNSTGTDEAGAIRWTGANFEGYDGVAWNSLGGVGFTQWGNTGGDIFFDTGFVGIGTNTPAATLDVNGASRISGGLGINQLNDSAFALEVAGAGQFSNEIVVGNSLANTAGAIRFNAGNFEGYDGFSWNSLGGGGSNQWTNDGFDNIYYNMGTVGVGGFATSETFTVQGTSYLNGNVGIGTNPSGTYGLDLNGTAYLESDVRVGGAISINTGSNPGGLYSLEVTGNSRFNDPVGIGTDSNNLFALNIQGDVNQVGDMYIQGALCVDGGTGCPSLSPGGIYGDLAYAEFDVAENILANQDIEAGDLVSAMDGQTEVVRKTVAANEPNVLGIISTDPGSLGGVKLKPRDGFKVLPLVLSGRVPVKVSTENGAINVGDPITSSSVAGVAMKATQSKTKVVGYAMQSYDQAGVSKIIVFYQPGYLP